MMNKNSDVYVVIYTVILTIVCGTLLALASEGLKPYKEKNIALDLKKNILATTMDISGKPAKEIEDLYKKLVKVEYVVDSEGNKVKKEVDAINVLEEYSQKKDVPDSRLLPVYEVATLDNPEETTYYVFPMYGFGLWDYIWGYVSFDKDFSAIKGTVFAHKGETAGLGARIAT
ncbi:MAG: NADH:ubiquinone reductase (Na(+)-transporting) subunit C, partial [Bacteroidota bacterium]